MFGYLERMQEANAILKQADAVRKAFKAGEISEEQMKKQLAALDEQLKAIK